MLKEILSFSFYTSNSFDRKPTLKTMTTYLFSFRFPTIDLFFYEKSFEIETYVLLMHSGFASVYICGFQIKSFGFESNILKFDSDECVDNESY